MDKPETWPAKRAAQAEVPALIVPSNGYDFDFDRVIASELVETTLYGHIAPHKHRYGQLMYVMNGVVRVEADNNIWTVPPRCALWLPGDTLHSGRAAGHVRIGKLYIEASTAASLKATCSILLVTPLLRELIM